MLSFILKNLINILLLGYFFYLLNIFMVDDALFFKNLEAELLCQKEIYSEDILAYQQSLFDFLKASSFYPFLLKHNLHLRVYLLLIRLILPLYFYALPFFFLALLAFFVKKAQKRAYLDHFENLFFIKVCSKLFIKISLLALIFLGFENTFCSSFIILFIYPFLVIFLINTLLLNLGFKPFR